MSISVNDILSGKVILDLPDQKVNFPSSSEISSESNDTHIIFSIENKTSHQISFDCDDGIVFKSKTATITPHSTFVYALSVYSNSEIHLVQHSPALSQDYTF